MNRDQLIQCRNRAMIEVSTARGMGFSDEEILAALREGNEAQKAYADFIEHEIMKGENFIPEKVSNDS